MSRRDRVKPTPPHDEINYASHFTAFRMMTMSSIAAFVLFLPTVVLCFIFLRMAAFAVNDFRAVIPALISFSFLLLPVWGIFLAVGYHRIVKGRKIWLGPVGFWIASAAFEGGGLLVCFAYLFHGAWLALFPMIWFLITLASAGLGLCEEWETDYTRSNANRWEPLHH